ncbi:fructose-specific PTS transporter subunit EIIC [Aerococcus sp. 1KP-2016]|uniref:PTS fructose transporter subunit IIABC n=1 Tax=Aerococcus sp. 1KP-2016 TaxID=1981982 RepID=UPI000B98E35F|nr:fructose-specific PTS transporter subunit EIIC [Aerococcus sp. 1KP-2016]OYQ66664.1 PTS fructose transporter subunit IIC [Aerococcus sp. 1KP-2016]
MKITDVVREELMILDVQANTKAEILDEMVQKLVDTGAVNDFTSFREAIQKREDTMSTGLGNGIAMPHAKNEAVSKTSVVFAKKEGGLDFESLDGQPAELFFMIAAEGGSADTHLKVLAELSKLLMNEDFIAALKGAETPSAVTGIVKLAQAQVDAENRAEEAASQSGAVTEVDDKKPYIVAVTACPTGIAHTYMAEDALKKKAAELGYQIKVETRGSEGVKHGLTAEDIEKADGIIVAVSKNVPMGRFNGKKVVERPVADGINKTEELINLSLSGDAPVYHAKHQDDDENIATDDQGAGSGKFNFKSLYNDLMSGISAMLPFVIAGGIILAISFLVERFAGSESAMFLGINAIGAAAFSFLIPVFAGNIARSIGGQPALVSGFAAGALANSAGAGFLGGLVGGFLAGYVTLLVIDSLKGLPKSLAGTRTILFYPVFTLLITGIIMYFILGPIFAGINTAMINFLESLGTGNLVLLGAILGGMMSIDMGGPFNKAAYAFAIGIFTDTGDGKFMAAVMAGGMVPPLAIALASVIFKNKFTEKERQSGLTNFIMGLTFITEGAIPFAAADPLRVITSSIIGSAVAGGLTQFFATNVPAPHGGVITMVALGNHPSLLILSVAIGAIISALILGLWKKPITDEVKA